MYDKKVQQHMIRVKLNMMKNTNDENIMTNIYKMNFMYNHRVTGNSFFSFFFFFWQHVFCLIFLVSFFFSVANVKLCRLVLKQTHSFVLLSY